MRGIPDPTRPQALVLVATTAAGFLGLLPGARGALDPGTLLVWLALLALPAGFALGAAGLRPWPYGLAVPGCWALLLVIVDARAGAHVPTPLWAALAWTGLATLGGALGARLGTTAARATTGTGLVALAALVLAGGGVQAGLTDGREPWARTHPRLAARLLDASPVALVLDCSGLDWTHRNPRVYRASGVEWFQRRPYRAPLAGATSLVVGCLLGELAGRRRRPGPGEPLP